MNRLMAIWKAVVGFDFESILIILPQVYTQEFDVLNILSLNAHENLNIAFSGSALRSKLTRLYNG